MEGRFFFVILDVHLPSRLVFSKCRYRICIVDSTSRTKILGKKNVLGWDLTGMTFTVESHIADARLALSVTIIEYWIARI